MRSYQRTATPRRHAIRRAIEPLLIDTVNELVRSAEEGRLEFVAAINLERFRNRFNRIMTPQWTRCIQAGATWEESYIVAAELARENGRRQAIVDPELITVQPSDRMMFNVETWLGQRQVGVWLKVSGTMHRTMVEHLTRFARDGVPMDERAKLLRAAMGNTSYQAWRIARTESTAAMNFAQQETRLELGVPGKKWVSAMDERTRPGGRFGAQKKGRFNHREPNGQIVPILEPFTVSGQFLMHPGDVSLGASAGNVVFCRCAAIAAVPKRGDSIRRPEPTRATRRPTPTAVARKVSVADRPLPVTRTHEVRETLRPVKADNNEHANPITQERVRLYQERAAVQGPYLEQVRREVLDLGNEVAAARNKLSAHNAEHDALLRRWQAASTAGDDVAFAEIKRLVEASRIRRSELERELSREQLNVRNRAADIIGRDKETTTINWGGGGGKGFDGKGRFDGKAAALDFLNRTVGKEYARGGTGVDVRVALTRKARAFASGGQNIINVKRSTDSSTIVHEVGHVLERLGEAHEIAKGFLFHRVGDEALQRFPSKWGRFKRWELGRDDNFATMYPTWPAGARYAGKGYDGASEIFTMGLEQLYADPVKFATLDPEWFKFIVGLLNGALL